MKRRIRFVLTCLLVSICSQITLAAEVTAPIELNTEKPVIIQNDNDVWRTTSNQNELTTSVPSKSVRTLTATMNTDEECIISYNLRSNGNLSANGNVPVTIYIDNVPVRNVGKANVQNQRDIKCADYVSAGEHSIRWEFENTTNYSTTVYVKFLAVMATPLVSVNLYEPGSLGTEVLYNVDGLKEVKKLKVTGKMNDDDWAKIKMMDNLVSLDLRNAVISTVPKSALEGLAHLHDVVLPEGLKSIDEAAFRNTALDNIILPSTLETVGKYAFQNTSVRNIVLPNSVQSIGDYCFYRAYLLENATLSSSMTTIPDNAFQQCFTLGTCIMPEGISKIESYAFEDAKSLCVDFPVSLSNIESCAFQYCDNLSSDKNGELELPINTKSISSSAFKSCSSIKKLILNGVSEMGSSAFSDCSNLEEIVLGTNYYNISNTPFSSCSKVSKITMKCPTVITHPNELGCDLSKVDLLVPKYLLPSYKQDSYWYNYKTIAGFATSEITDWAINNPLVLSENGRFEGTPNIVVNAHKDRKPSLKINGDPSMTINNLYFGNHPWSRVNYPGMILCNSDNIVVNGKMRVKMWTEGKYWYFFSMPFDVAVKDIETEANVEFAIRYYDGANRAANGAVGSWKNYDDNAIIPAGTGFIFQTNKESWITFWAVDNASKQNAVSNKEFVKNLDINDCANASNKGWNLVGNPWQCYYNNHAVNFTAPITVWDAYNRKYIAYSLSDDDYAIRPNEAFFVQCPGEELQSISFPTQGRQLTDVIDVQNAAKSRQANSLLNRQLIDLEISNGDNCDKTRVVINEDAALDYDIACDASKFISDSDVPQIYTIGADGVEFAINERPLANGEVQMGFFTQKPGAFTISMPRCDAKKVYLLDTFDNIKVDLSAQDYGFTAKEGKNEARFRLIIETDDATDIATLEAKQMKVSAADGGINIKGVSGTAKIFTVDGRLVATHNVCGNVNVALESGVYVVRMADKSVKIAVK